MKDTFQWSLVSFSALVFLCYFDFFLFFYSFVLPFCILREFPWAPCLAVQLSACIPWILYLTRSRLLFQTINSSLLYLFPLLSAFCQNPCFSSIEFFFFWLSFHYGHIGSSNSLEGFPQHLWSLQLRLWPHVLQAATPLFKMHFLITTEYTLLSVGKVWILISCGKKHDLFPTLEEAGGTKVALRIKKEFGFVQVLHDSSVNTIFYVSILLLYYMVFFSEIYRIEVVVSSYFCWTYGEILLGYFSCIYYSSQEDFQSELYYGDQYPEMSPLKLHED